MDRQGAMTRQIAGAASGTHEHDIECCKQIFIASSIQELSGVVPYGVSLKLPQKITKRHYIGFKTRFNFGTSKNQ
jgi:hypothetical protein